MPGWNSRRFAAIALFLAWLSPANADVSSLEGTWMHVGDRYGLVPGYIEQVDISRDGEVSVRLFRNRRSDPGCEDGATGGICHNPQETVRGKLKTGPSVRLILLTEQEEIAPAFHDQKVWQALRFAGSVPWTYGLDGDVLRLSRGAPSSAAQPGLLKIYHRVDPRMPADLYDFLIAMSLSIWRAGCAVDAIQADADMRAEFRRLIADIASLARGPESGAEGGAANRLTEWLIANPDANDALYPGAESALPQIRTCLDQIM